MLPALIIFLLTYLLMLALPQYRPFAALGGAALFLALGAAGLWDFTLMDAARACGFQCPADDGGHHGHGLPLY